MLPSCLTGHWCLYAWDMEKKRVHVLDPVLAQKKRADQSAVHMHIIAALHDKFFDCIVEHFSGWDDDRQRYKIVFYNFAHPAALQ